MKKNKENLLSLAYLFVAAAGLALFGASCGKQSETRKMPPITVWGVFDDSEAIEPFLREYSSLNGGSKVTYKKISPVDQYEQQLLQAFAENRGPDVFLINNAWVPRWKNALLAAPAEFVTEKRVNEEFVDVVSKDFITGGKVLGLPLFVDSLALYYNKDIFNDSGIARAPRTWEEVMQVTERVTRFNAEETSQIDRHGIALGSGKNVNRAPDILSILMMQNGVKMTDEKGLPVFGESDDAVRELQFFTDFANLQKKVYTWNQRSDYSIDTFAEGEAAMMINYSYHMATLRLKNPRLNFAVAALPQLDQPGSGTKMSTYASYWGMVVSRQTTAPEAAWRFISYMANVENSRKYLSVSGYPPAQKELVNELQNDARIGVFAKQSLYATDWEQADSRVTDRVFTEAIDEVVSGVDTPENALRRAAQQITAATNARRANDAAQSQ